MQTSKPSVLLVGGGIGGMAAALALARLGISIDLLEQSAAIGEIGAGLQLGPNAFAALDALGVGEAVRRGSVFTDRLVMMDAVDCSEVASVPVGEAFRARFRNPYAVSHRADLHGAIHEAVKEHPLIRFHTSAQVEHLDIGSSGVTASSIAMQAPCARYCSVGCAASPSSVTRPKFHCPIGSRSAVAQRVQSFGRSMSWRALAQMPSK